MICVCFIFSLLFIFSPLVHPIKHPKISQYVNQYFWVIYSGPFILAALCFIHKRLFKDPIKTKNISQHKSTMPVQVEMYQHDENSKI